MFMFNSAAGEMEVEAREDCHGFFMTLPGPKEKQASKIKLSMGLQKQEA